MLGQIVLQMFPIIGVFVLLRSQYSSKIKWLLESIVFGLGTLFAFLTARWDITSYYLRVLIFLILAVAIYVAYRRVQDKEFNLPTVTQLGKNAGNIILIVVLGWLNISVLHGYLKPEGSVDLTYPLGNGVYYIGGGGNSRWINNHNAYPPQDFALDIVELSVIGNSIMPGKQNGLEKYAIYGAPIYSPCDGTVLVAVDEHKDQIPPQRDLSNPAGNYILLECFEVEILLAHLKQGSVMVSSGDKIRRGDEIGAVGNSGNSSQPHLHIHAEKGGADGAILDGEGVPITFEGRFLVRNNLFIGSRSGEQ